MHKESAENNLVDILKFNPTVRETEEPLHNQNDRSVRRNRTPNRHSNPTITKKIRHQKHTITLFTLHSNVTLTSQPTNNSGLRCRFGLSGSSESGFNKKHEHSRTNLFLSYMINMMITWV
ncbi:hypothetical protein T10_5116 [Trichinella papuae]|uniref:Uncharacterized protein n=1 Tax=Trichinella papuae TaxID=268474 RepID=A0A0V1N8V2_9BILA|nr:hypothetical protein T10_5116 [Trichinella papuae]